MAQGAPKLEQVGGVRGGEGREMGKIAYPSITVHKGGALTHNWNILCR